MKRTSTFSIIACASMIATLGMLGHAATFKGTVTNKTTNRPSPGDAVQLVDVQAGMSDAASGKTDSSGQYSLDGPAMGPYLIRVTHQGGSYFIAAPQGGAPGDVNVYDVAAKVDGVGIDADMLLIEAGGSSLRVHERFLVRNTSLPPRAQFSDNTFEIALPDDAEIDSASATRPGGLGTNTRLVPLGQKGHYTFNIPIQPNQAEKETLFELQYHLPYNGKYSFAPRMLMPADNFVVYLAKGIDFKPDAGVSFRQSQDDPRVQTYATKNVTAGETIRFSISGEGQMPHEAQNGGLGPQAGMGGAGDSSAAGAGPGGGIGAPIGSPDPLTKYKWWILSVLALALIAAAIFLLGRKGTIPPAGAAAAQPFGADTALPPTRSEPQPASRSVMPSLPAAPPRNSRDALLALLKDEMFAVEQEKLSGTLSFDEYARVKTGLDALLKRLLASRS